MVTTATSGDRATAESIFHFTVTTPTTYSISGSFSATDAVGATMPGIVELEAEFFEFSSPAFMPPPGVPPLFYSHQKSVATLNETFGIGGMGGDDTNTLAGSPVGLLVPGKGYRYRTLVTINALATSNGSATAFGTQTIGFTAVPESSSLGLVLVGGLAMMRNAWRRFRSLVSPKPRKKRAY